RAIEDPHVAPSPDALRRARRRDELRERDGALRPRGQALEVPGRLALRERGERLVLFTIGRVLRAEHEEGPPTELEDRRELPPEDRALARLRGRRAIGAEGLCEGNRRDRGGEERGEGDASERFHDLGWSNPGAKP